jgi:hypothetical protein
MLRAKEIEDLARSVLAKMYEDVQSSERVIPRTEMPEFKLSEMRENIAKFGEFRVKKFIEYQEKCIRSGNQLLPSATQNLSQYLPSFPPGVLPSRSVAPVNVMKPATVSSLI